MKHFYRVRALVDSTQEEGICWASCANVAMATFEKLEAPDTGEPFGTYGIHVVMIHRITFGEEGPIFEDATHELDDSQWDRADYEQCLAFIQGKQGYTLSSGLLGR